MCKKLLQSKNWLSLYGIFPISWFLLCFRWKRCFCKFNAGPERAFTSDTICPGSNFTFFWCKGQWYRSPYLQSPSPSVDYYVITEGGRADTMMLEIWQRLGVNEAYSCQTDKLSPGHNDGAACTWQKIGGVFGNHWRGKGRVISSHFLRSDEPTWLMFFAGKWFTNILTWAAGCCECLRFVSATKVFKLTSGDKNSRNSIKKSVVFFARFLLT